MIVLTEETLIDLADIVKYGFLPYLTLVKGNPTSKEGCRLLRNLNDNLTYRKKILECDFTNIDGLNHQFFTIEPFHFDIIKRLGDRSFHVECTLEGTPIYHKHYIMKVIHMDEQRDHELNELLVYRCLKYHKYLCPLRLYFMYILLIYI